MDHNHPLAPQLSHVMSVMYIISVMYSLRACFRSITAMCQHPKWEINKCIIGCGDVTILCFETRNGCAAVVRPLRPYAISYVICRFNGISVQRLSVCTRPINPGIPRARLPWRLRRDSDADATTATAGMRRWNGHRLGTI